MASTPIPPSRPIRPDPRLSLKRVVGTTCTSPTGFDAAQSCFAYIAGGAVVVVDVHDNDYTQRFYRARPTALPTYSTPSLSYSPSTPSTPKANDSRNRSSLRESTYGAIDWSSESPSSSKTWTSRERIKAATCLALSRDGRFLAVGETGYAPRVLIFSLEDVSSDTPLVSISEHAFGVCAVAWSPDGRLLASLGTANDGFLYVWRVDPRTGAAKLFQQNRCTSYIRGMLWVGSNLVTLGVRHVKVWRVEEARATSPRKYGEVSAPYPQKTLPGRNVLLGNMIDMTFSCAATVSQNKAIICSETGDVCLLEDTGRQMKLTKVLESGFVTTSIAISGNSVYLGGKNGGFLTLDLASLLDCSYECVRNSSPSSGLCALGFLKDKMVSVDMKRSMHISEPGQVPDAHGQVASGGSVLPIPGHGEAILGIERLPQPNVAHAAYCSWSASGHVILWDVNGKIRSSFTVPLEQVLCEEEGELNQLTMVKATSGGNFFVTGDKLGFLKVIDFSTKECVSSLKVHSSECSSIATYEGQSKFLIASCGRDRTTQLIHRTSDGTFQHFQTLEFAAKVAQVLIPSADKVITCSADRTLQIHELVTKEDDVDSMAAITAKTLPLKASPASMTVTADGKCVFVSTTDRCVSVYDLDNGKMCSSFKCTDENGVESVVLTNLHTRPATDKEPAFLLGISNTDKSIRIYDALSGTFLDREWGHTEAINGVTLIEDEQGDRKIVSVGSDGTIMVWDLDLEDRTWSPAPRDPSPEKDGSLSRAPLRRVLSKAELAEFQRPGTAQGRTSPPRTLNKRRSGYNLRSGVPARTPLSALQSSPAGSTISESTPTRRKSSDSRSNSPPPSPKSTVSRQPSVPSLRSKTRSNNNLRGFGSLNMATEQASRSLRAYRKKLSSTDPISQDVLAQLDQELRLTAVALGDRATRSKAMSDTMLSGLLDQYSERLVSMLDEKLRISNYRPNGNDEQEPESPGKRPQSSGSGDSSSSS